MYLLQNISFPSFCYQYQLLLPSQISTTTVVASSHGDWSFSIEIFLFVYNIELSVGDGEKNPS